jgi:hypothetical protein
MLCVRECQLVELTDAFLCESLSVVYDLSHVATSRST